MIRCGLIGLGRAGMARRRVMSDRDDCIVMYECSRRDPQTLSYEDVLASDVDAVMICRESERHETDVRAALEAEKHVLVEYPLALNGETAFQLSELARQVDRILHVGHFSLLNPFHQDVERVLSQHHLATFEYEFNAGFGRAVRPLCAAALWGQSANSRLQVLWSWFGHLELEEASVGLGPNGYELVAQMRSHRGVRVTLRESRREGQRRGRRLSGLTKERKSIEFPRWSPWEPAFAEDTHRFMEQIKVGLPGAYVSLIDVAEVVALSAAISVQARVINV